MNVWITLLTASLCATLQFTLTLIVIARRIHSGVRFMQGNDDQLLRRMRAHGNLIETVPIVLVLMALLEISGLARHWLLLASATFLMSRVIHACGLINDRWRWGRQVGMTGTLLTISALACTGLVVTAPKLF